MTEGKTETRVPPGLRTADDVVGWCGTDAERLHLAYMEEVTRPAPQRRPGVAQALTDVLGWPLPDTPPTEVLAFAGTPGLPLARVLGVERARPVRWRRAELVDELERRTAAAGEHAFAVMPATAQSSGGGWWK